MKRPLAFAPQAVRHLRRRDPGLRPILDRVGPCWLQLETNRFAMLTWSIIGQQISIKAAASIRRRLAELIPTHRLTPAGLQALSPEQLRSAGLSAAKARYLHDLADKAATGAVNLKTIHRRSDEEIIEHLVQVKGIGRWTAEMFLMFSLGRPDVLPVDDLGLRVAMRGLLGATDLPAREALIDRGECWRPYRSVAVWYLWQNLKTDAELDLLRPGT